MNLIKPALGATESIGTNFALAYGDFGTFITNILPLIFVISGLMVGFYFIIGAFELITSQGEKGHIVSARSKIYHAIIGLVLLIALFFVVQYLIPALVGQNTTLRIF